MFRLILFLWFTVTNALVVWQLYGAVYREYVLERAMLEGSFGEVLPLFAAGLAAPVAFFPIMHVLFAIALSASSLFGTLGNRAQELREHAALAAEAARNVAVLRDPAALALLFATAGLAAAMHFGLLEHATALGLGYAFIGTYIGSRLHKEQRIL